MDRDSDLYITFDPSGLLSLFSQAIREIIGCTGVRIFRVSPGDELVLIHAENPLDISPDDEPEDSPASIREIDLWVGRAFRKGVQQHITKSELLDGRELLSFRSERSAESQAAAAPLGATEQPTTPTSADARHSSEDRPARMETLQAYVWNPLQNEAAEAVGVLELSAPSEVENFTKAQLDLVQSISNHLGKVVVRLAHPPCRENSEEIYRAWMGIWSLRGKEEVQGSPGTEHVEDPRASRYGEEKMAGIARLAAGIAHEINNPLAIASANAGQFYEVFEDLNAMLQSVGELLEKGAFEEAKKQIRSPELDSLLEDTREMTHETKEALGRIAKVVSQMMKFGEQSTEKVEEIDLVEEAQRAVELFRLGGMPNSERRAEIELETRAPVRLFASRNRIRQIFVELLENALRAANQNRASGKVDVRIYIQEAQAVLEVQDNGPGIDFESQQRIFDPFYTTKRNWRSTGLGLTAVYGIVKSMNGSISLQSSPGNGAHFSIYLPTQGNLEPMETEGSGRQEKSGRYYEDLR